jgi:hypothetical protein
VHNVITVFQPVGKRINRHRVRTDCVRGSHDHGSRVFGEPKTLVRVAPQQQATECHCNLTTVK